MPKLFNDVFLRVKGIVASAKSLSFTSDGWDSRDKKHSILSLSCHFLNLNFEPKFMILGVEAIKGFKFCKRIYIFFFVL